MSKVRGALVAGVVLTGGASRRMGWHKALMEVAGLPNAVRLVGELGKVAGPVVEVGPGWSGAPLRALEEPPGAGPLAALAAGAGALRSAAWEGPALVVACDMPFVTSAVFELLAGHPAPGSVIPLASGRLQPLCARWSWEDLLLAELLCQQGSRSMKALLQKANFAVLGPEAWPGWLREEHFSDIDTPEQAAQVNISSSFAARRS